MDVKEFFYEGGIVKCHDRTESDVVIEICRQEGLSVYAKHDPDGICHGVFWDYDHIGFYMNGCDEWESGTPFSEWMEQYAHSVKPTPVEDLL